MRFLDVSNLRGDVYGGITAGVVALPLALAFGEASGAGPIAGLWGAILVGFFASLFGGTGAQISGPTGPMVVVFAGAFASLAGNPVLVAAAVILAGVLQVLFGVFRFGQYIRLVPYPVVSGFMSGIGCIIIALQLSRLFGHEPEDGGTIPAIAAIPGAVQDPNIAAALIGAVTLVVVFAWPKSWGKYLPGALAGLIIGTLLSLVVKGAPLLGEIPTGFPALVVPELSREAFTLVLETAFILAVLGSIDSLLTSLVADNMTRTRHNSDRELVGQGIGNAFAGFLGGIPGAGATMRTVVNIRAGGRTKISGMLHALLLLSVVISFAPLASLVPHAVLAGILVKVGYDIIDFPYIRNAHRGPRWDLILMVLVLGMTVFVDLITAVAVGVVLAALAFVKKMADDQLASVGEPVPRVTTEEERRILEEAQGAIMLFDFSGPLSFGAAADFGHYIRERLAGKANSIVLDFSRVPFIDVSAARAVETVAYDAHQAGDTVYITGMSDEVRKVLTDLQADHHLTADAYYEHRIDALRAALAEVRKARGIPDQDVVKSVPVSGRASQH